MYITSAGPLNPVPWVVQEMGLGHSMHVLGENCQQPSPRQGWEATCQIGGGCWRFGAGRDGLPGGV